MIGRKIAEDISKLPLEISVATKHERKPCILVSVKNSNSTFAHYDRADTRLLAVLVVYASGYSSARRRLSRQ